MVPMRHRLLSVLVLACVPCGLALAQPASDTSSDDSGITINPDALNEPPPPPPPADAPLKVQTLPPVPEMKGGTKAHSALTAPVKRIPTPRQKPEVQTALATTTAATPATAPEAESKAKAAKRGGIITATAPATPEMPVTILENSPVEMHGVATDPFASQKIVNPIEGFKVLNRVRFGQGETSLPDEAHAPLDALAAQLVENKRRVRLVAFSGRAGDMSSQSRRLSLERANAVRSYLVSKGVAFDHVDIMPYGGANDGIIDRVDVLLSGKS